MATPTVRAVTTVTHVPALAGELIAVVGPDSEQRARLLLALGRAGWATTGPAFTVDAGSHAAAAWAELRRAADDGATVVAACEHAEDASPYAHRMVLLPHTDGHA